MSQSSRLRRRSRQQASLPPSCRRRQRQSCCSQAVCTTTGARRDKARSDACARMQLRPSCARCTWTRFREASPRAVRRGKLRVVWKVWGICVYGAQLCCRTYSDEEWRRHRSSLRYLPDPKMLCAPSPCLQTIVCAPSSCLRVLYALDGVRAVQTPPMSAPPPHLASAGHGGSQLYLLVPTPRRYPR